MVEFISESEECEYTFEWTTPFACVVQGQECAVHSSSGYTYDLSSLAKADSATGIATDFGILNLNVCNGVHKQGCDPRSGACLAKDGTFSNVGQFSDVKPKFVDGKARLDYIGGVCPEGLGGAGHAAATHITFYCSKDKQRQGPELNSQPSKSSTGCTFSVHWYTCAVCDELNPCQAAGFTTLAPGGSRTTAAAGGAGATPGTSESGGGKGKGAVAAGIIVSLLLVVGLVFVLKSPDRRGRVAGLLLACKPSGYKPTYMYQPVSMALLEEEDGEELTSVVSSGAEPAQQGHKSLTDALNSESEEDDLLLGI